MASAVESTKVLVVDIIIIKVSFVRGELAGVGAELGVTTITSEVSFGVKFNELMVLVTSQAACEAYSSSLGWVNFSFGAASEASIQSLSFDVAL